MDGVNSGVHPHRCDRGEPAHRACQIGAAATVGHGRVLATVPLDLDENRPIVGDLVVALVAADGPREGGEHDLGATGPERVGCVDEDRLRGGGRYADLHGLHTAHRPPSGLIDASGVGISGNRSSQ